MTILAVFKSRIPSMQYFFADGRPAVFIGGKFSTAEDSQINELARECGEVGVNKSRHPYIYIDENEKEIDTEALSPLELIKLQAKEEARNELLAEQAAQADAALDKSKHVSTTEQGSFASSVGNSDTIAQGGVADSNGASPAPAVKLSIGSKA